MAWSNGGTEIELGRETFKIQRAFRGYWARKTRNEKLYERETGYRNDMIAELQAEGNWWKDNADLLERRLKRRGQQHLANLAYRPRRPQGAPDSGSGACG